VSLAACGCTAAPIDVARARPDGLLNGLFAHWSFDDVQGTTVPDDSASYHVGVAVQATVTPMGRFGNALQFQGGEEVTVDRFPAATPSWTVSLWAQLGTNQPGAGDFITLLSTELSLARATALQLTPGGWEMNVVPVGPTVPTMRYQFAYYVGPAGEDYAFVDCECFVPDVWTHVAAVVDGAKMHLYVNGTLRADADVTTPIAPGSPTLYMASWYDAQPGQDPTPTRYLTGALDDVAIWNRALDPSEVAQLSTEPAPDRMGR
jgi:hypothetical protein